MLLLEVNFVDEESRKAGPAAEIQLRVIGLQL